MSLAGIGRARRSSGGESLFNEAGTDEGNGSGEAFLRLRAQLQMLSHLCSSASGEQPESVITGIGLTLKTCLDDLNRLEGDLSAAEHQGGACITYEEPTGRTRGMSSTQSSGRQSEAGKSRPAGALSSRIRVLPTTDETSHNIASSDKSAATGVFRHLESEQDGALEETSGSSDSSWAGARPRRRGRMRVLD